MVSDQLVMTFNGQVNYFHLLRTKDCTVLNQLTYLQVLECTKEKACETAYGVYNHNSPAYSVSRGDCICYSGDFVCQRPREGERLDEYKYEIPRDY